MRDAPRCLHCGLRHRPDVACIPVADIPSEWPRIEAEREARIRADERARIVAELRDIAEHHLDDELAHYFGRVATVIETELAPEDR